MEKTETPFPFAAAQHSVVLRVLTAEDGGTGRRATRDCGKELVETHTLLDKESVRGWHVLQIVGAHVVSHNEDEVRL